MYVYIFASLAHGTVGRLSYGCLWVSCFIISLFYNFTVLEFPVL